MFGSGVSGLVVSVRRSIALMSLIVAALLGLPSAAVAATITVTSQSDSGPGSLRADILSASAGDTVVIPAGFHITLSTPITVTTTLTIQGNGTTSIVDGANATQLFHDTSTAGSPLVFQDLELTQGRLAVPASTTIGGGAAIQDTGTAGITLTSVTITGNAVTAGSAARNVGGAVFVQNGPVSVDGSTISNNNLTLGGGAIGNDGGAGLYYDGGSTTVTVSNSTLSGNSVTGTSSGSSGNDGGGAIYNDGESVTLTGDTLTGNSVNITGTDATSGGGAVYNNGFLLTVTGSTATGNSVTLGGTATSNNGGGAFYNDGFNVMFTNDATDANSFSEAGGVDSGGGALYNNGFTLTITGATFAQNDATLTGTVSTSGGGAIFNDGGSILATNATIDANALSEPAGSDNGGGAIYHNSGSPTQISFSTIDGNQSNQSAGFIFDEGDAATTFKASILSANGSSTCAEAAGATTSAFASAGYNLQDTTPSDCGLAAGTHDLIGATAALGGLADNGGNHLPTQALRHGSQAVDAVPAANCTDQSSAAVTTDERGIARPQGGACDIGAYEAIAGDLSLSATGASTVNTGTPYTVNYTAANAGPGSAASTTLAITLPSGATYQSATASAGTCTHSGATVTCALGTLGSGATATASLAVSFAAPGAQTINATLFSDAPDSTPADNSTATNVQVISPTPVNTSPPVISGTPLPGDRLTCSPGSWTNAPTRFAYAWNRNAKLISGATGSTYIVQILDEAATLTCVVTASNPFASGSATSSKGVLVAIKGTTKCPKPSGSIAGRRVGPLALGMTRTRTHRALKRFKAKGPHIDDFCLYGGWGIRVAYSAGGSVTLALTANPFYALNGITPGQSLALAKKKLKLGKVFHVGANDWYIAARPRAVGVLKVRHGVIQEVGLANSNLTATRAEQSKFLRTFNSA
jgi:hypothetical protein